MIMGDISGKTAVDLCAAPGGKTMQLATGGALVTALDISDSRLKSVEENLARTGLEANIVVGDVAEWKPREAFELVLLDAPCSATGTIRRHPDALYLKKSSDIDALVRLQEKLLAAAKDMVGPDGLLIYCTCSLQKREGELQIEKFLQENEQFERVEVRPSEIGGLDHLINEQGDLRTLPFHEIGGNVGMDGFFVSRLRRKK